MADGEELFTASQAAEALNVTSQTIRNWIRAERLHAVRIGHRFLIPRSEVDRLRGESGASRWESPWDSAAEAPVASLPRRMVARAADGDESDRWLGG